MLTMQVGCEESDVPDYELQWEQPPADALQRPKPQGRWESLLSPLLDQEGKWARVATDYSSKVTVQGTLRRLRKREIVYPPGQFEFAGTEDSIYARYMGPDELQR